MTKDQYYLITQPFVSIILVNYNTSVLLRQCLRSVYSHVKEIGFEIITVDNGSSDGSREAVRSEFPEVRLLESETNLGFSRGNNLGAASASGKYLLFLNTDTILSENSVKSMAYFLEENPGVGAVGPRLIFEDGSFQLSAGELPSIAAEARDKILYMLAGRWKKIFAPMAEKNFRQTRDVGWVTGACLMVPLDVFRRIGGFDDLIFMYFEDKDLCRRIRESGLKVIYYPVTSVVHLLGGSSRFGCGDFLNECYRRSQRYYYDKHARPLERMLLRAYLGITGKG